MIGKSLNSGLAPICNQRRGVAAPRLAVAGYYFSMFAAGWTLSRCRDLGLRARIAGLSFFELDDGPILIDKD
jgi:hypothetical protein